MGAWVMGGRDTPRERERVLAVRDRSVACFPQGYPKLNDGSCILTMNLTKKKEAKN